MFGDFMSNITAIILTGGFATRLRPLTLTRPKALLPILDKPLLDWIIKSLRSAGVKDIILSVRYLANLIRDRYGDGSEFNVRIEYAEEVRPLGDAGPIPVIASRFSLSNPFLVIYGDIFTDVNIAEVIKFHKSKGGLATLVLTKVEDPSRYGVAVVDKEGLIREFIEKPPREVAKSNLVNAGIYVFDMDVLKYFPHKTPSKLSKDVIPRLVSEAQVYAYIHEGIWSDIGVPSDYKRANFEALLRYYPEGYISSESKMAEDVEINKPVFIGSNTVIDKGSKLGPLTIIGSQSRIGPYTRIYRSILLDGVVVEGSSLIEGSIIGRASYIGRWVRISDGCVLGDEVTISDEVFISNRVTILPYKEINESIMKPESGIL
ncbi:MAG TPA: NDP-sugar synthase [Acidilobales archaeon]|nr:NDP-sugar synthase [Acidilobales archaeon]